MFDVLDTGPIAECAREITRRIGHPAAAARMTRLVFAQLRGDGRNFRPVTAVDLITAPSWAWRKYVLEEPLYAFMPCRSSLMRLRNAARRLDDACLEIKHMDSLSQGALSDADAALLDQGRELLAKIRIPGFTALDDKARIFARARKRRLEGERATKRLCVDEIIAAPGGAFWSRVISVAMMWLIGIEFRNCMARDSGHSAGFARLIRDGAAQIWVLRDANGKGVAVALIYPNQMRIDDIRGPSNTPIDLEDPRVAALVLARGWRHPHMNLMFLLDRIRSERARETLIPSSQLTQG